MQTELNHTVKSLFDKNSLDDLSREDLLLMTVKYPYSAIFQFLYTRKLQSLHDLRFPSSVAKTAIYFSNPHWLNHQLRSKTSVEALAEMEMAFEKSHAEEDEITAPVLENIIEEPAIDSQLPLQEEKPVIYQEEHVEDSKDLPDPVIDFPEVIESSETNSIASIIAETENATSESGTLYGKLDKIMEDQVSAASLPLAIPSDENMEIPLEPLYAVDYFASQGIRLREEDQQDQLGKKLKSFTEWLKSMKKVHPEKSNGQMDEKTEASIKSDAEQSNDKAVVLTETMAEVFVKQGLTQKALDVYEKLSLLDPVKSATFAAKISELKAKER